jgi:hypothetical protein
MDHYDLWKRGALRGANAFPRHTADDLSALRSWGANLVSFGVASILEDEEPFGFDREAFDKIDAAVKRAEKADLFATINYRSAPGRKDFNHDLRQFQDFKYHDAFVEMWRETARRLKGSPTLVGSDLMCEPHPEDLFEAEDRTTERYAAKVKGTPADWNLLARRTTEAIREDDPETPIIVNATGWAYHYGFPYLEPTGDPRTVYSVHYYSPRHYTHQRPDKPITYPGRVPAHVEPEQEWSVEVIANTLAPVREFEEKHDVPIFVGEFGCARYAPGVERFLHDQIDLYEEWKWPYAYWDLRGWHVMDIEMSADASDKTRHPDTPLLRLFRSYFAGNREFPTSG